jgi:6-phosphofructokinase 1
MVKNVIVGQSGGPTSVINASLVGVFQAAQSRGVSHIYGMLNGIQGLLEDRYVDLSETITSTLHIELLKRTPSSYLGSCRYKLPEPERDEQPFKELFALFEKLNIGYFFYIGGNDSMDTINKLSRYAAGIGNDIRMVGVPKTIDNDLVGTDHTPGYGSAAKYIAATIKEIIRDGLVYNQRNVTVVEVMGRNAGWLTGATALSKGEDCEGIDMICLPETDFDIEGFITKVDNLQKEKPSVVIAVSEGIKTAEGKYVCELADYAAFTDAFGHRSLSGAARYLANRIASDLGCKTRSVELSTLQRCAGHITSRVDITEAFQVGGAAVKAAFEGLTWQMVALKRLSDDPYQITTQLVPIDIVANKEKKVPLEWLSKDHLNIKEEFLKYVRPLIQAELPPFYVDGLPRHIHL